MPLELSDVFAHIQTSSPAARVIDFSPVLTGLIEVGTVTKSGTIRLVGDIVFYTVRLAPGALSTLWATFLTTYVTLPYVVLWASGAATQNVTNLANLGMAIAQEGTKRLYLPTIAATGDAISISGWFLRGP